MVTESREAVRRTGARRSQRGDPMEITRGPVATTAGPGDWFTGAVQVDAVAAPSAGSRIDASWAHVTPGSRPAWHTHPSGQTIVVTEGAGRCQCRGGPVELLRPGDRVFFEAGEDHWHGATADRFMAHMAMLDVGLDGVGNSTTWGELVTHEEYGQWVDWSFRFTQAWQRVSLAARMRFDAPRRTPISMVRPGVPWAPRPLSWVRLIPVPAGTPWRPRRAGRGYRRSAGPQ